MANVQQQREFIPVPAEWPGASRTVDTTRSTEEDPAEPWELPATQADLEDTRERSFERLPHLPASPAEVPGTALEDLRAAVGELGLEQLFVIPRIPRPVGAYGGGRVVTPTQVMGVGSRSLAVWMNDGVSWGIRAQVPFEEVAAIIDRNILLNGRLELVAAEQSIVVRYNAVGRPELRALLLPVRRALAPVAVQEPATAGAHPHGLPHKWRAFVQSSEVLAEGSDEIVLAAGDLLGPAPRLHNGVAILTSRELLVATDPTSDLAMAQYGVDLLAVPRARVRSLDGAGGTLVLRIEAEPGPIEIRVTADPSLVAAATATLGPLLTGSR